MAYQAYLSLVQELYIGYYQRPAAPGGLVYWAQQVDYAGGNIDAVVNAFATSPETQAIYGDINDDTIADVVSQMYNSLFNRNPAADGLAYYVDSFIAGEFPDGRSCTAGTIVLDIINGATGVDRTTMDNKLLAADMFTETIDPGLDGIDIQATYSGDMDASYARTFLTTVSSIPESIPSQVATVQYIRKYIADPGDAILISQYVLTEHVDDIDLTNSISVDTVSGIQTDPNGTFTPGDSIIGNNLTVFELIADGGAPVVAKVENVAEIDIFSVEDTTIEAVGFDNIGAINVTDGGDGNWTGLENLEMGVPISIFGVTGTISSSYDVPRVDQVNVRVYNADRDTTASALLDVDGNLNLTLADEGSGEAIFRGLPGHGEIELDTISVLAGDDTWSEVNLGRYARPAESVDVGQVNVVIGDPSYFRLDVDATGDVNIGDASMVAGSTAQLKYEVYTPGDIGLDEVYMTAGYSSTVDLFAGQSDSATYADAHAGNIAIGDITQEAGGYSNLDIFAGAYAEGKYDADASVGNINMGDVYMSAGYSSSLDLVAGAEAYLFYGYGGSADADAGNINIGDVNMTAGYSSSLDLMAGAEAYDVYYGYGGYGADADAGNINIGAVNMTAGDYSGLDLMAGAGAYADYGYGGYGGGADADAGNINILAVNMTAGYNSSLDLMAGAIAEGKYDANAYVDSITIGAVNMIAGHYSEVVLGAGAVALADYTADAYAGNIAIGDVNMEAGYDSFMGLIAGAVAAESVENFGMGNSATWADADAGNITMGNINMAASGDSDLYLFAGAMADGYYDAYATAGNINIGNISMDAGGAYSEVKLAIGAVADAYSSSGYATVGNITVGNISMEAGDYSGEMDALIGASAEG